jgi:hypothetical protein
MTIDEIINEVNKMPKLVKGGAPSRSKAIIFMIHDVRIIFYKSLDYLELVIQTEEGDMAEAKMFITISGKLPIANIRDFNHLEEIILECKELRS